MALTRNGIVNKVMGYIGISPTDANYAAMVSKVRSWLNDSLQRVANDRRWPELETTVDDADLLTDESTITLETDCLHLTGMPKFTGGSDEPLKWLKPQEFDANYYRSLENATAGTPVAVTRKGRTLHFNCPSDEDRVVQYDYYKRVTLFGETDADSEDVSEIKDIDDILVELVTAKAFKDLRQFAQGNDHFQTGMEILHGHDSNLGGNPDTVVPYIAGAGGVTSEERHWR